MTPLPAGLWPAAAALALACAPAHAQDDAAAGAVEEQAGPLSVEGAVTLVSDYRFRGISLSNRKPALQPELWLSHESGFYAGFWGSTLAEYGGAAIETDVSIGWAGTAGPLDVDVNATWYLYPGGKDVDYLELTSTASADLGFATVGVELAYAPAQANIGGVDNLYGALHLSAPLGKLPLKAVGSLGIEDGAFGDRKLDWSAGLGGELLGLEWAASCVGAARDGGDPLADTTVVFSVKKAF